MTKREIKFRAYHPQGRMEYYSIKDFWKNGFRNCEAIRPNNKLPTTQDGHFVTEKCLDELAEESFILQTKLMQSTSLLDKNQKEIFEGDIVESFGRSNELWRGKVSFALGAFGIFDLGGTFIYFNEIFIRNTEIIGNIYEHPELLNEKN